MNDFGDPLLNAWALAWVPHALATHPTALFDANIFYPQPNTLALSETLLFPALLVAPLRALGATGIDLHNVVLFSGYILSGLTMFVLIRSLTGNAPAAVFAAVLITTSPLRAEHYPRVQAQMTWLLPLALLCLYRITDGAPARGRAAVLLGLCLGLQFYSCVYYAVFFCTVLPIVWVLSVVMHKRPWDFGLRDMAWVAVLALALVLPAVPAYRANERQVGERSLDQTVQGSAVPNDYARVTPGNWFYNGHVGGTSERHLFTGYLRPAAALAAIAAPPARWLPLAAACAVSWDISLGVNGHLYRPLYRTLLPYHALRVPARMAMILDLLITVLAGIGCSRLLALITSSRIRMALVAALCGVALLESVNRPFELREMDKQIPPVYDWLANAEEGPIVEYPAGGLEGRIGPQDATYMYFSTAHWRPLLNGYSGFAPASYYEMIGKLEAFPSAPALAYLRERGVRFLVVHERYYLRGGFEADVEQLSHASGLVRKATFDDRVAGRSHVYEFVR